ncbi:MAG: tetratricopeptide repeat protein [Endomicrobiia bacterium]
MWNKNFWYLIITTLIFRTYLFSFKYSYYYYSQALLDIHQKNYSSAIEKLEKVIKLDPEALDVYPQLIYLYVLEKQENKLTYLIKEIEKIEVDTATLSNIGNILWIGGYTKEAAKIFEKILSITPNNLDVIFALAQIYFYLDEEKSIYYYKKYLELNPNDTNAYFQLALLEYKRGNPEKAKEYLKNLNEEKDIISSILFSDNFIEKTTDYTSLILQYENYLKQKPNDYKILTNLFFLLLSQQDIGKAEQYFPKILSIPKKEFLPVHNFLIAIFYEYKKEFKKAIKYMEKYIKKTEVSDSLPYLKLIYYYYSIKNYKKTFSLLETAKQKFNEEEIKIMLLYAYIEKKNYNKALEILFELKSSSSSFERIDFYIGMCYEQLGDIENSIKYLKEAIAKNPEDHEALNYLGYLYADRGINLNEAEQLIKKALEVEPTNYAYIDSLAWVYYKKEDYKKAEELFEQIKNYSDPIIYEHIGDVKASLNKFEEALIFYKKSLKLNNKNKDLKNKILKIKSKCKSLRLQR